MLDWRSIKSERLGDSVARRARSPARVCGNLVGSVGVGIGVEDEKDLLLFKVRARAIVKRDRMVQFCSCDEFLSLQWWL